MIKLVKKYPLLTAILFLAAFLRLYQISGYMEFLGDQGRDVVIVRDFLKNGNLFFIGPQTSIGNMYLGPYYYYLIAPFLFLANFNPVGPAIFVALLSVATVALIYILSRHWFDTNTALFAALLYTLSPIVIKYANFSWNPNIMPFFALLFIYFFTKAIFDHHYQYLLYTSLAYIMIINSHYLGLLLLPVTGFYWLIHLLSLKNKPTNKKRFIKFSLQALGIFLLSLLPQILFDIKHQGQNIKALIKFFAVRQTTVNLKAYKAIPNLFPLFSQITSRLLGAKNDTFGLYISLVLLIALAIYIYRLIKAKKASRPYLNLMIVWYGIGLIGLGLYKQHIYDHYFGFLFPPVFILAGLFLSKLVKFRLIGRILAILSFSFLVIISLYQNPFRYPPNHQLKTVDKITQSIIEKSQGDDFNLALLAKQNYDPPYRYIFYQKDAPLYRLDDNLTSQLFVICEPHPDIDCYPINHPEWAIAAFGWAKIDQEWQINDIKIYRLLHTQGDS